MPVKEEGDAVAGACSTGRNGPSLTDVQTAAAAAQVERHPMPLRNILSLSGVGGDRAQLQQNDDGMETLKPVVLVLEDFASLQTL